MKSFADPFDFNDDKKESRQQKRRAKYKRTDIYWNDTEHSFLSNLASQHNLKLTQLIKKSALAYHHKLFILPDESLLKDLTYELTKQGTNLNQIAWHLNRTKHVRASDIDWCIHHIKAFDKRITDVLQYPDDLMSLNLKAFEKRPEFITELQYQIHKFLLK